MRIAYDAKRLYNNFTGLGNYSRFVVEAVINNFPNKEWFLFTPSVKRTHETERFLSAPNLYTVLPPPWIRTCKFGSVWRSFGIPKELKKREIAIYHGLSHELPVSINKTCKSVVTVHDLIFIRYPQFYNPIDRWIYLKKLKQACAAADVVVAVSEQTKSDLINYLRVPDQKITVIYQGCHSMFKKEITVQQKNQTKIKYNLPDNFMLNVGTIEARKNSLLILKAMAELNKDEMLPLVIAGRSTTYKNELVRFAEQHKLTKFIHFLHNVDFADLPALYSLSTVFIYPSFFEGFGIPLVEAINCDIPVITSTGSCFSEAAGPASRYIDPTNHSALAEAIIEIATSELVRKEMVEASKKHVTQFEPQPIAHKIMEVYRSIS